MNYQVSKMRLTLKRILQALFLAVLFSFSTLAVFRSLGSFSIDSPQGSVPPADDQPWIKSLVGLWPDRSLRSVAEDAASNNVNTLSDERNDDNDINTQFVGQVPSNVPITTQPTTTATAKTHATLDDVFISVKTTKNFHSTRLDVIIKTWFTLARDQV